MARSPVRGSKGKATAGKTAGAPKPKQATAKPTEIPVAKAAKVSVTSSPLVKTPPAPPPATEPAPVAMQASPAPAAPPELPAAIAPVAQPEPAAAKAAPVPAPEEPKKPAAVKAAPIVQPNPPEVKKVAAPKQEILKMAENTAASLQAKAALNEVNDQARAVLEKGTKMIEEFSDFTKGNVEAFVAAGRAAAKGAETLGQNAADYSRRSFEDTTKALKTLTAAKSPTEFFKLQNEFAKSQFDAMIAEASKVSEAMVKIFGDVSEPITTRASVAADKFKTVIK